MKILDKINLGLQSYCLREFTQKEALVEKLKECGLDTVEICGVHVDFHNSEQVDEIIAYLKENGITINSAGVNSFTSDESSTRDYFEFAKKAGLSSLSASIEEDAFDLCERLCVEYGVKLAIHNHGKHDILYGTFDLLKNTIDRTSSNIGICLDTAWMIDAGDDPVEAIYTFKDRIYGIHFKDFAYDDGNREEAIYGEGSLDSVGVIKALKDIGFKGYASIEYEGEPEKPIHNIKKCIYNLTKQELSFR